MFPSSFISQDLVGKIFSQQKTKTMKIGQNKARQSIDECIPHYTTTLGDKKLGKKQQKKKQKFKKVKMSKED